MRWILLIIIIVALAACGRDRPELKPDLPDTAASVTPEVVIVEKIVYVAIDPRLTRPEPVAEGPITQCFEVAAQRRAAIAKCNVKLAEIAGIEGTEVEP